MSKKLEYPEGTKVCRKCEQTLPLDQFAIVHGQSRYTKKDGTFKVYNTVTQRHICRKCTWTKPRKEQRSPFVIGGIRVY